ncbi:uncharacterized protein LACBIDRAFT_324755 [Laccaria bicolor S238N-H82]|uniref:Predicted protein n=1 Tax=Laccaria bicolor (strain S238N-H82 / ATCC MYA-4686) TaxID=486041 RepID=B0D2Y1_LACBS|nr:uncharacterized protein LACBIDRAFT_324755 [Laccaria bicolor S238N-H82]EDR11176.1 predicted protein [Laccaria bicolor S238N-H82]|eukprot:XP_001878477.1 predicted protein [Laccaria bicolor S238N-H82]
MRSVVRHARHDMKPGWGENAEVSHSPTVQVQVLLFWETLSVVMFGNNALGPRTWTLGWMTMPSSHDHCTPLSLSTTTDSDSQSVHVKELGKHPIICFGAPGNSEGISRFGQEFTAAMENNFANPSDSWGNPPSLVPLIIPTSPAIHCTLSAANAVPSGSPFASHALSTAYFKPSISHQPIGRLTYASNSPSRTSLGGCFIR